MSVSATRIDPDQPGRAKCDYCCDHEKNRADVIISGDDGITCACEDCIVKLVRATCGLLAASSADNKATKKRIAELRKFFK